jgi:cysteinyl-tRNA synthetase
VPERVRDGNAALASGDDAAVITALGDVRAMLDILGVDPQDVHWTGAGAVEGLRETIDDLVSLALEQRAAARARKDWAAADAIRDELNDAGVVVEDTPTGPRWTIATGEAD